MKIIVLGADGYLGWPTSMYLSEKGYDVAAIDNYSKRKLAIQTNSESLIPQKNLHKKAETFKRHTGHNIVVETFDCSCYKNISSFIKNFNPDVVIHFAEQPSAPYSMIGFDQANFTLSNNINTTFALLWAVREFSPNCHIIKLGTMGEYGTPNIDIEEGWIEINHKGRKEEFLYPRQASSLYHTTKILDTDLIWFYVRNWGITVTDLMQGPVYGLLTNQTKLDEDLLPNFHYDDIFGTVVNRFLIQAIAGIPLTTYGSGNQIRGYLNIIDTLQCIYLAIKNRPQKGTLKIYNQFTEQLSVNQIARTIKEAGDNLSLKVEIQNIVNPRKENEEHYYNASKEGFKKLGLNPTLFTNKVATNLLETLFKYKDKIDPSKILPRINW